jgi:hypothetical protein
MHLLLVFALELLHCAVYHREVVAAHRDHLVARREVLQNEEMGEEALHLRSHQDVAKDREDLIGIQHPFLFAQTVSLIESLDFVGDAFRTSDDCLHLTDGRLGPLEIPQLIHTGFIGLVILDHHIFELDALDHAVLVRVEAVDIRLDRFVVQAKSILHQEAVRSAAFQVLDNKGKFGLALLAVKVDSCEHLGVEDWIFEEDCSACTQYVFIIGYEIVGLLQLCEASQVVVVNNSFPQDH